MAQYWLVSHTGRPNEARVTHFKYDTRHGALLEPHHGRRVRLEKRAFAKPLGMSNRSADVLNAIRNMK